MLFDHPVQLEMQKADHSLIPAAIEELLRFNGPSTIAGPRYAKADIYYNSEIFKSTYEGLEPIQIIELKALMEDSSDNIPGVPGIGEKGAMGLMEVEPDYNTSL
ncbi:5'-3' exonuclease H3TH domain-containing protein [Cytobacillus firmus]|uniref:5'-3' exonuclease H3TH domain-containing protein n=1 Tax=Cytobacillus firmus TaxID=1399 RepID=UPI0039B6FC21